MKKKSIFYVRIDIVDLMDFATDPDGENMSLLQFAKELKKEKSEYPKVQRIINEANRYWEQKKEAGRRSAALRAKKKKEEQEVQRRSNGVATEVNGPSTNNRNNNRTSLKDTAQGKNLLLEDNIIYKDGIYVNERTGEESPTPF